MRVACALALVFLILGTECGVAQEPPQATPPQTTNDALHAMSRLAGVIFAGQVIGVRRLDGGNGATGVVEITFAVEDAVRGVSGSTYMLREWAGLWPAGDEPFRVGQRYLMLLHAPGAAGLSSPVGGMDGAIPIRGSGQALGPQATGSGEPMASGTVATGRVAAGTSALADGRVVDLRWVGTRVVQPLTYKTEPVAHPIGGPITVHAYAVNAGPASTEELETASSLPTADVLASVAASEARAASASQGAAYATVLGMLRSWEKADHATR